MPRYGTLLLFTIWCTVAPDEGTVAIAFLQIPLLKMRGETVDEVTGNTFNMEVILIIIIGRRVINNLFAGRFVPVQRAFHLESSQYASDQGIH